MPLHYLTDSILEIPDFLSPAECTQLIARSEQQGFAEAGVGLATGAQVIKSIRNNYRLEYPDAALAETFWQRLRPDLSGLPAEADGAAPVGLYEQFRFYRYDVGERFNRHKDGSIRISAEVASRWTFLLYLNDDFEGGATEFETLTVAPRRGSALCFRHELRHKGCPVTQGRKYVLRSDILYRG
ncbi:prolyl hydroxylase family protein [Hymenobacter chitinivorans]|uniref:Putative 2-oxoglutarate/Fe(II)-dependent dioxygenase YbiX n=1 Tax=Hymenobacter chitinivorans DSM 11115 TaxID=1121954 RepID=A0A2M9BRE7_9BACT|nr:2OG-Fe(II) oxygenase [Hymenobacter chitinivorans]PJJ60472.1 putative 2-oxoglutarate/Fe(II)-dependent dioxygenase YbiX [Hymenobacter chitinivorans DSM 11115]